MLILCSGHFFNVVLMPLCLQQIYVLRVSGFCRAVASLKIIPSDVNDFLRCIISVPVGVYQLILVKLCGSVSTCKIQNLKQVQIGTYSCCAVRES
jgi:hypothetical protein